MIRGERKGIGERGRGGVGWGGGGGGGDLVSGMRGRDGLGVRGLRVIDVEFKGG